MAERSKALEVRLAELGEDLHFPTTPDLAGAVRAHLQARPERARVRVRPPIARLRPRTRRTPAWALACAVLLATVLLGLSPAARRAVADWLGLPGLRISIGRPTPSASELGHDLNLGRATTLAGARADVPFSVGIPAALGPPDEVYLTDEVLGPRVSLIYRSRPGLPPADETGVAVLVTQFEARVNVELMQKVVASGAQVDPVSVNGAPGYWISGEPHLLLYAGEGGRVAEDEIRLAANVLAWQEGTTTLRLESALGKRRSLAIARSVH
jgi:hypothetical protein